jgi:2'-5' RNA ligase
MSFDNHHAKPGNNPYVLFCDSDSDAQVAQLRQALAVSLRRNGLHPVPTKAPHMTLVYDRQVVAEQQIGPFSWEAGRFALILSHVGLTHHQWLGEWQLI